MLDGVALTRFASFALAFEGVAKGALISFFASNPTKLDWKKKKKKKEKKEGNQKQTKTKLNRSR
jgi:hypothetical protein